jgi:hypothetical protein
MTAQKFVYKDDFELKSGLSIAKPTIYKCSKHGEVECYITSNFVGFEGKYCQVCYMELIKNNCCELEEIK